MENFLEWILSLRDRLEKFKAEVIYAQECVAWSLNLLVQDLLEYGKQ
jgi:hypothetical protein